MKIRCFKKSDSGNVRVDSPNKADLISVSKDDVSMAVSYTHLTLPTKA